ncbi:uncharacterized protein LDX57_007662 [Aspergillus melleus]|uniref:uncharacterized protein n=1 Tax=Aspergillus melleus TaxID=138277 RepID=UPI001E8E4D4F|nr:uncharacterized protein LDX57_007662 [Aspergillus melleus]KAH8429990.1 hypothetical protein LDX57_007662 [Aspergillus melleus]
MWSKALFLSSLSLWARVANAAFGLTTNDNSYVIDAGSPNSLVFTVSRSSCDITSIKYYGSELQYPSQGSHIGSGLGSATVSAVQDGDYIKVTCEAGTLTHYFVVHNGDPIIHMATHITAEPSIGELRFIARLNSDLLPNEEPFGAVSTTSGGSAIEGSDVFNVNGQTRSKFYSSQRFIDDQRHCISGSAHRVCMILNQYEGSSGGPFFR